MTYVILPALTNAENCLDEELVPREGRRAAVDTKVLVPDLDGSLGQDMKADSYLYTASCQSVDLRMQDFVRDLMR
jgi:hypothetical protein